MHETQDSVSVLVVAAHPDDEVLGCGGTIAKHSQQGDIVHVHILAEGATSRSQKRDRGAWQADLSILSEAADQAGKILGAQSVTLHAFPDNRMDGCELLDVVKVIEHAIAQHQPQMIYTHHSGDVNIDHRRIHEAVVTACRPTPGYPVKTLLFFEVASSTEWHVPGSALPFMPNWFVDISETLSLKLQALETYQSELRSWPHPRSLQAVEALALWRGASVGVAAAEAFILGRKIIH